MKKTVYFSILIFSFIAWFSWRPDFHASEKIIAQNNETSNYEKKENISQSQVFVLQDPKCTITALYSIDSKDNVKEFDEAQADDIDIYKNVSTSLNNRGTSITANINLFKIASSCPSIPDGNCPIPTDVKIFKVHPIELLEKAAELGSSEAKLMYAVNASSAAAQVRNTGLDGAEKSAREIMVRAEEFGIAAAQSGSSNAYRFMSHSYERGIFGPRNMEKAYAFSLPLKIIGTQEDKVRIEQLKKKLTESQNLTAERFSFGCAASERKEEIVNPFGKIN